MTIRTEKRLLEAIKAQRTMLGLSQFDVAAELDVEPQTVCLWETGRRHMKPEVLFQYLDLLGLTVELK